MSITLDGTSGITASGNITGNYILGNGSQLSGVDATGIQSGTSNVKIVSSGGNATVSVAGTSNVAVFASTGANITGTLGVSGNVTGGNLSGTSIVGTLTTAAQTNITSVGTLTSLAVTGNITSGNLSGTSIVGTLTTAAQTNITSVGTLTSLAVTGNVTGGNFVGTLNGSGANVTSISATNISSGTLSQARLANASVTLGSTALTLGATVTTVAGLTSVTSTTFVGALTGAATTAGTVTTAAQTNITSVGTLTSLAVTGNITGGNLSVGTGTVTVGNIVNANGNAVGNIGSSTLYFNTVFAKATSAQYADLAELYTADDINYPPGTCVAFGGLDEITQTTTYAQTDVAGVVSTNPAYIMNAGTDGLPVALQGRVPCRVVGTIAKGDLITSSNTAGVATRLAPEDWRPGVIIGKSLQHFDSETEGVIEVVVGRV